MSNLFTRLFGRRPTAARPKNRTFLRLESLDERVLPSATSIIYHTTTHSSVTQAVIKKTIKKNVLTMKNLPPGNYTASYHVHLDHGPKMIAKPHAGPHAQFTVIELDDA